MLDYEKGGKFLNEKDLVKNDYSLDVIEKERYTEIIEEYINIDDSLKELESNNDLIRMEMNIIEFPIFSKNRTIKHDIVMKYYFSNDKKSFLEVIPSIGEPVPGDFEERVFISLLQIFKAKGYNKTFYCTPTEILENIFSSKNTQKGFYSKLRIAIKKISETIYRFSNLFYSNENNGLIDSIIRTTLISSTTLTFKDANPTEQEYFSDRRVKEIYKIILADEIYENLISKGYLVFEIDELLNLKDSVTRSIYTQITKWRNKDLYLRRPAFFIARRIPLSWKGNSIRNSVLKIGKSLEELKNLGYITDFNVIKRTKVDTTEFEIFFSEIHNKNKQKNFYSDKIDFNNIIHDVEERINEKYPSDSLKNIIAIFGPKGAALKTLPNVIKEALNNYEYDYVKYTAEYTAYNAKASLLKYFKDALTNNWADEYIAKKKVKEAKVEKNSIIENAIIIEENKEYEKKFSWIDFEELSMEDQNKLEEIAYNKYLAETNSIDNKITKGIFEKTKKGLITKLYDEFIQIKSQNHDDQKIVDINIVEKEQEKKLSDDNNSKFDYMELELKSYPSIAKFTSELYLLVKKRTKEIELMDIASSLKAFKEYEDDYYYARFDEKTNLGGYREKL